MNSDFAVAADARLSHDHCANGAECNLYRTLMIGPALPARVVAKRSTTPTENVRDDSKASQSIGPALPAGPQLPAREPPAEEDEDEDDYMPELPPDLAAARERAPPEASKRKVHGPSFPSGPAYDDDDDEVGPMPLPGGFVVEEKDGVTEFLEKEEKRRKQVEVSHLIACPYWRTEVVKVGLACRNV